MDFESHNQEVKRVWDAFHKREPHRIPVIIGASTRASLLNPAVNTERICFREYTLDPEIMLRKQLEHHYWVRHNIMQDAEMGLPAAWSLHVDFQNMYEAAWLGAPIRFEDGNCPYAAPMLTDENKESFLDEPIPDPFDDGGWMSRNWEYYDFFQQKRVEGFEFMGRPIGSISPCAVGTDGPFTLAAALRGTSILADMLLEPDFFSRLMDKLTSAIIMRMIAYRQRLNMPEKGAFGFADDSVAMLSLTQYIEHVLPSHKRLVDTFADPNQPNSIHLCGDAQRFFPLLRDRLNIYSFDTGYPINWNTIRAEVGPEAVINGGPAVILLLKGPVPEIVRETKRILDSPAARGGRFILREANNLAPCTPLENISVFYKTALEHGKL
ncbi:MAG TPA: uroporphyrinogen decarboxylase family protein [Candidatus Brocadiia bacterium]|nr:uroporphyrinogen decarboxylase family protein [Candidatus Brocadiia bacterium]